MDIRDEGGMRGGLVRAGTGDVWRDGGAVITAHRNGADISTDVASAWRGH